MAYMLSNTVIFEIIDVTLYQLDILVVDSKVDFL